MSTTVQAKSVVDIPPFQAVGRRFSDGSVFVQTDDVVAYLEAVAEVFDAAGAVTDIGLSLRAIAAGMGNHTEVLA